MAKICLKNVHLKFQVRRQKRLFLKELLVQGLLRRKNDPPIEVHSLQDINLEIHEGERVGLIGHNGAGKSTLLKVLAGIYPPTSGTVEVHGEISALFDLKLGFEPDASGWENICFRGYLQGETPRTLKAKIRPTADFSELDRFLDMPVRYYSSGMAVRLAFSIATAIEPDILLVDEVLSVGDKAFREKARLRMREMIDRARLIVLVSHDLDEIETLCDRVVWMEQGRIRASGPPREIVQAYTNHVELRQLQTA